jgi:hypothetical protein
LSSTPDVREIFPVANPTDRGQVYGITRWHISEGVGVILARQGSMSVLKTISLVGAGALFALAGSAVAAVLL